jgi:hypothetical protein
MRSKTLFHPPVTFFVIVISVLPAFSLTPEQCRVATESCISKCDPGKLDTHDDCIAACSSKLSGPCAANLRGSPASNKGPVGPTKGTHPIVGVSPPASVGVNKGPPSAGPTTLEKSGGGKH